MSSTIEQAAEDFRNDAERNTPEGKVFSLEYGVRLRTPPLPCIFCKEGRMKFFAVDAQERIELRIGRFNICRCDECGEFAVCDGFHKKPEVETHDHSKTTAAEYNAMLAPWLEDNKDPEGVMTKLREKWAAEDAVEVPA